MNSFNINKILERHGQGLDMDWLAKSLFPSNKYPKAAFTRVLKGEMDLTILQVEKLAECLGVMPQNFFGIDDWKGQTDKGVLSLTKNNYLVKLDSPEGNYATIYKDGKLLTQVIISSVLPINKFITLIDSTIDNL